MTLSCWIVSCCRTVHTGSQAGIMQYAFMQYCRPTTSTVRLRLLSTADARTVSVPWRVAAGICASQCVPHAGSCSPGESSCRAFGWKRPRCMLYGIPPLQELFHYRDCNVHNRKLMPWQQPHDMTNAPALQHSLPGLSLAAKLGATGRDDQVQDV